jgi:ATP-dependent protease ClpP protease subunit
MKITYEIDKEIKAEDLDDIIEEPEIVRVTDFGTRSLESFQDDLNDAHRTGQPIIPIVIDTHGGDAYACQAMISAILDCELPVATIVTSKAMSAGAILFMFGTDGHRYMDPNATLMIHDIGSWTGGKNEDIKSDSKHIDWLNQTVYKRASKHLGHKDTYLLDLIKKEHHHVDWYLTAKDAKKHKIVNHLRVPKMHVEVKLNITFG